ncbi:hypothetical protein [Fischerella sp. JS2]|uniref:hypothetical protein n=1 Tax=Fischerella sp. JS2 TaxID=2597771 RepID=UPI0028EBB34A|nr:hypothetical protein [Fischerella sp. JS2]
MKLVVAKNQDWVILRTSLITTASLNILDQAIAQLERTVSVTQRLTAIAYSQKSDSNT